MSLNGRLAILICICLLVVVTCKCNFEINKLTYKCDGRCDGYDACIVYDRLSMSDTDGCRRRVTKDRSQNISYASGDCQTPDDSGCVFQCFHLFDAKKGIFNLTFLQSEQNESTAPNTPWIAKPYVKYVDVRIPDYIDTLKMFYNTQGDPFDRMELNISFESIASGRNLETIYFDGIQFLSEKAFGQYSMPNWNMVLGGKSIKSFTMKETLVRDIMGGSFLRDARFIDLSGSTLLDIPPNLHMDNARTVVLRSAVNIIPQALASAKHLRLLRLTDPKQLVANISSYNRSVTPELYDVLNNARLVMDKEWTSSDFDCEDGHIKTIEGTSYKVCVLGEGGMSIRTILGIVALALLAGIMIVVFILYLLRRKKRMPANHHNDTMTMENDPTQPFPSGDRA